GTGAYGTVRLLLPGGRPAELHAPVHSEHLHEDVVAALVLRDDEAVRVADARDALFAADQRGVLLRPGPLRVDGHDVEPDHVDFLAGIPEDRTGTLAESAGERNGDVLAALLADRRVLVAVRNRRAVVAGIADGVEVLIRLGRVRDVRAVVADIA